MALISLGVAICAAGFSFFQWYVGDNQAKINAAIKLSRTYLGEKNFDARGSVSRSLGIKIGKQRSDDIEIAERYVMKMNYIAGLINEGQVNAHYIANDLKCDLYLLFETLEPYIGNRVIGATTEDLETWSRGNRNFKCKPPMNQVSN